MKIIIDSEIFTSQKRGGISRHFSNLISSFKSRENFSIHLNSFFHTNLHLKEERIGHYINYRLRKLIRILHFFQRLIPPKADIIQFSYYPKNVIKRKIPIVTTAYDMIPESGLIKEFSQSFIESKYKAFKNSKAIICISNATKDSLINYYPEFKDKLYVIHLGLSQKWEKKSLLNYPLPIWFDQNANLRYLTYIGNRFNYKNAQLLIKALHKIKDINLVFVGGELPSNIEKKLINNLNLNSRVKFIQANDNELIAIIKNSYSVCIPSKIEGFSLPLVEALYLDVPVIASNIKVHKEVAYKFAYLLDPENHNEWSKLLSHSKIKKPSQILGKEEYSKLKKYYSYERIVEDHINLYQKLI